MEVRTRRSAGVTGGPLNPAMISLLPLQRLKEELQNRGLDVRGNKDDLAMRLEDHVRLAEGGRQLYDPSPFSTSRVESESPKKNKRGYKRKVDDRQPDDDIIDIENTEQLQPDIQILTNPVSVAAPPLKFNWAKEKPSIATVLSLFPKAPEPPIFHVEMPQVVTALKTNEQPSPNLLASTPPVNNASIIAESPVIEKVTVNNAKASKNKESINQNGENQERLTIKVKRIHLENKEKSKNSSNSKSPSVTSAEHTKVPVLPRKESKDVPHKKILAATPKTTLRKISTGFDASDISTISNSSSPRIESSLNRNKLQNRPAFSKEKSVEEKSNLTMSSLQHKKQKVIKEQRQNYQQKRPEQIEKRRATLASGEDVSTKLKSTPKTTTESTKEKVSNQSPGFDILDSILDKQEQLLARKTATLGMGKSVAELTNENSTDDEEVNELLELELKKRKQRMDRASGLSAGTTTGNIQSSQTSLSTSTVNYSETSRQQTINKSPINTETSPRPVSFKRPHFPFPSPPPPPPKKADREDHFSFVNSISSNSPPLIVDRRDPLGLSSIGPDTPPPPPPPSRHTAMPSLSIASLLPPPPPPPPRAIPSINSPDINYTQPKANEQHTGSINPSSDIEVISSIVSDLINTVSKTVELCVENNVNKEHENHIGSDKEMGEIDEYEDGELSSDEASNIEDEEYYEEQSQVDEMEEENDERSIEEEDGDEILIVDEFSQLLKDPKALLHKASDVLRRKFGTDDDAELEPRAHYEQVPPNADELKIEEDEEYRQLPDPEQFHGEPASTSNNWLIDPDNADGFALMWGGVRANYGIIVPEQRDDMPPLAFQVKIAELLSLKHLPFEEPDAHDIRLGWSRMGTSNMLGESPSSFAFNSMANKATGNIFADYGEPFGIGDVITAVLDINCGEIRFFKNSQTLGPAFTDIQFQTGDVFFPHVATKNCKVYVYFGNECPDNPPQSNLTGNADNTITDEEINRWGLPLDEVPEGTKWIGKIDLRMLAPSRRPISDKAHCTIIAMVGLSGVGKTSWVRQYLKEHPEEDWVLLNNDSILQSMAVNGVPRQRVHQGRWDMVMGLTAKALNRSLQMACRRRHNYILDQTNVTRDARKRKLTQFQDFQRKCVVIIPSEAEHERRLIRQAREQGGIGQMPAEAMLEMKGNFSIPSTDQEPIEDVIFIEPPIERLNEAIEQVVRYNEEGQPWVRQQQQRFNRSRGQPQSIISDHSNIPFVGVTRIGV
uniref:Heterogeneous nuclear ribonucleoprotein U-like protein 1 n=1 Tax=Meloidogyne javanica TaxID=6303 RepID=A0A915N172_MELJA